MEENEIKIMRSNNNNSLEEYRKARILISELAEACRRPLFVEIALREQKEAAAAAAAVIAAASSTTSRGTTAAPASGTAATATATKARRSIDNPEGSGSFMETESASGKSSFPPPLSLAKKRHRSDEHSSKKDEDQQQQQQDKDNNSNKNKAWEQLITESSEILPYVTEKEHAAILRYASILLLGYLLPYSTGNEATLLQNAQRRRKDNTDDDSRGVASSEQQPFDPVQYILRMDLEERIETSVKICASHEYGEVGVLTDTSFELAFHSFIGPSCLGSLLDCKPSHPQQVDLLHVLAMAVHPRPNYQDTIPHTSAYLDNVNPTSWQRAKRLMRSLQSSQFQLTYQNRMDLVELVTYHLSLSELPDIATSTVLVHGAIPHLRASLRAFGRSSALSLADAHVANCALASIASQTRNARIIEEEWNFLLHTMAEDHTDYHCTGCHRSSLSSSSSSQQSRRQQQERERAFSSSAYGWSAQLQQRNREEACLHSARGRLLSEFIVRCFPFGSDTENDAILARIVSSLTDAIEWQVDFWTKDDDDDDDDSHDEMDEGGESSKHKEKHAPCLLASLLSIATTLFYYLPKGGDVDKDDDPFITLTEISNQLLRHNDAGIVSSAAELLVMSFGQRRRKVDDYMPNLLKTVKLCVQQQPQRTAQPNPPPARMLERVVAVAAQRSPAFGASALQYLLQAVTNDDGGSDDENEKQATTTSSYTCAYRLIASISSNCPSVASKNVGKLVSIMMKEKGRSPTQDYDRMHIVSSILSTRQARYLTGDTKHAEAVVEFLSSPEVKCVWSKYQIARHALETGNFFVASKVYKQLAQSTLTEKSYLWISALEMIASAEAGISKDGAVSIPDATIKLRSALSRLQSIEKVYNGTNDSYGFQICFLLLRLDFLDLLTVFRQLTREMRLTGSGPQKNTRPFVHVQNLVKSLVTLSFRYRALNRTYGLYFRSGRSTVALRVLQGASLFLASAAKKVFCDTLTVSLPTLTTVQSLLGDISHQPMAAFVRNLDMMLIEPMDSSMGPILRAAATIELIDGVLMVPVPFPRDFLHPRPRLLASLMVSAEPEQREELGASNLSIVKCIPAMCFTVYCTGSVPESFFRESKDRCWTILIWYSLTYNGSLEEDDPEDKEEEMKQTLSRDFVVQRMPNLSKFSPVSTAIMNGGKFFVPIQCPPILDEGLFTMEVKLGCRDVAGREWDLPTSKNSTYIAVRIARSR